MQLHELRWWPADRHWHRAEALYGLILLYRRTAEPSVYEYGDIQLTQPGNYRIIGVHPDRWHDMDGITAQAVLHHLLEKYQ